MTKKDFEAIAVAVKAGRTYAAGIAETAEMWGGMNATQATAEYLADTLAASNPRFDRARFLKACGVTQ